MKSVFGQIEFGDWDDASLSSINIAQGLNSWLQSIEKLKYDKSNEQRQIYWKYHKAIDSAILELAKNISNPRELRIALRPYYAHWQHQYMAILRLIEKAGYKFKAFSEYESGDENHKICFLRFDLHLRDLPGAFGFWDVNEAFGIPSEFYIHWKYAQLETNRSRDFEIFGDLPLKCAKVGLHTSPCDTWLMKNHFDYDEVKQVQFFNQPVGRERLHSILKDPREKKDILEGSLEVYQYLADDFYTRFPNAQGIIAAHGGVLKNSISKFSDENPEIYDLRESLCAEYFLTPEVTNTRNFGRECENLCLEKGILQLIDLEGKNSAEFARNYLDGISHGINQGRAFSILNHPMTFQARLFSTDLSNLLAGLVEDRKMIDVPEFSPEPTSKTLHSLEIDNIRNDSDYEVNTDDEHISVHLPHGQNTVQPSKIYFRFQPVDILLQARQFYKVSLNNLESNSKIVKLWVFPFGNGYKKRDSIFRGVINKNMQSFEFYSKHQTSQIEMMLELHDCEHLSWQIDITIEPIDRPDNWQQTYSHDALSAAQCACHSHLLT